MILLTLFATVAVAPPAAIPALAPMAEARRSGGARRSRGTGRRSGAAALVDGVGQATGTTFRSCAAARAAGAAPLRAGQPGYSTRLDRDRDGVACE